MSLTTAALRELVAFGLTAEQILLVAEANEAPARVRSANAERQARFRARKSESVTEPVTSNATDNANITSLPLPPPPQTPPPPTPTPGEQSRSRKGRPEKPSKPTPDLAERIWLAASKTSRDRSGRPVLAKAVLAAIRAGASDEALIASVRDHCRAQGEFAKGIHLIVSGEHWRDHMAANDTPATAQPADPRVLSSRLARYRDTGVWEPGWGPKPTAETAQPVNRPEGAAA